jgi:hypothetical protein
VFVSLQKPNASCEDGLAFSLSVSSLCVVFVFVYKSLMPSSSHHSITDPLKVSKFPFFWCRVYVYHKSRMPSIASFHHHRSRKTQGQNTKGKMSICDFNL